MSEKKGDIRNWFGSGAAKKKPADSAPVPAKPAPEKKKKEREEEEAASNKRGRAEESPDKKKSPAKKAAAPKSPAKKKAVLVIDSDDEFDQETTPKKAKVEPKKKDEEKKPSTPKKKAEEKKVTTPKKKVEKPAEEEGRKMPASFAKQKEEEKKPATPKKEAVAPSPKKAAAASPKKAAASTAASTSTATTTAAAAAPKKKWNPRNQVERVPPMLGLKPVPVGAENCLFGMVFVLTGVLESLERADAEALILRYAGDVAKSVAKKCTHALVGSEPGESKIKKIEEAKLTVVDEDGLFELIRTLPEKKLSQKYKEKMEKVQKTKTEGKEQPAAVVAAIRSVAANEDAEKKEMWTSKYAPQESNKLLANPGPINKVRLWLARWKNASVLKDKNFKRAILISGVPGIGKSTTAALLAREAGFDVLEYNASDARSKKRLKEEGFMEIGGNRSLNEFFGAAGAGPNEKRNTKTLVIMDEVDGMGGGDRGGNQELIALIKTTHVPVICICNDRQKASVKTLANYCEDIRFQRPQVADIAGRMKIIMENEGFKAIDMTALQTLCASVNNDIRQVLNLLQMLRLSTDRLDSSPDSFQASMAEGRHVELNVFSVVPQLFSGSRSNPNRALDLFFHDYDLMPLFVQENYLSATPAHPDPIRQLHSYADAADVISYGDLVKDQVMKSQDWALLPFLGMVSTVIPCATVRGRAGAVNFPAWLGKNSSMSKAKRLLKELQVHMSAHTSADKNEVRLQLIPSLLEPMVVPLEQHGQDGIDAVMTLMDAYGLNKDDWESLYVLSGKEDRITRLDPKLKAAFTRKYNKTHATVSVATVGSKKGKGGASRIAEDDDDFLDQEVKEYVASDEEGDDAGEDDVEKDALIKQAKKKKAPAAKAKEPAAKKAKK